MSYLLIAEDNPTEQLILQAVLNKAGYSVFLASGGREALDLMTQLAFDLAVIDIQMPELDGLEVMRRFRSSDTAYADSTPLLAISADDSPVVEARAFEAGASAWLVKPLAADGLREVVTNLLADELLATGAIHERSDNHPRRTLNTALLDQLRENIIDQGFIAILAERFLRDTAENIAALRDAGDAQRWEELRDLAHALQGSAGSVGAERLQAQARRLCRADDVALRACTNELIAEMDVEQRRSTSILLNYIATASLRPNHGQSS